jgi:ribosomal protein L29
MSNDQLKRRLNEIGNSLHRAVGKVKAGGAYSKDSMFIRKLKKERARILTILRERELRKKEKEAK